MKWQKKYFTGTVFICLLLGLFAALLFVLPTRLKTVRNFLDKMEWIAYDLRMRLRAQQPLDPRLILIGITDVDYYLHGNLIFNREAYLLVLQALSKLGVQAVLIDILFEQEREFDPMIAFKMQEVPTYLAYKFLTRVFPKEQLDKEYGIDKLQLQQEVKQLTSVEQLHEKIEELQAEMTEIIERRRQLIKNGDIEAAGVQDRLITKNGLILTYFADEYLRRNFQIPPPSSVTRAEEFSRLYTANEPVFPTIPLFINARGLGFINVEKEREEILRSIPLVFSYNNKLFNEEGIYPNLDLVFICYYYGVNPREIKVYPGKYLEFKPTRNYQGIKHIPIDERGNFLINFRQGEKFLNTRGFALQQLLHYEVYGGKEETVIKPELFKDAIVIIGENNVGGTDTQPIPLQPAFPLIGAHANVLHNILHDDYVHLLPTRISTLFILLLGLLMGFNFALLDYRKATAVTIGLVILIIFSAIVLFNRYNLMIPVTKPLSTIFSGYLFLILYRVTVTEKERRLVRRVFFKTVSPEIGEEILRQYDNASIRGNRQMVTVMFADIRGFTTLSEELKPEKTVELLNLFYDVVSEIIFAHGGQVNKFIGDEVMALFGAPVPRLDAEVQAILAAVAIQRRIKQLNPEKFIAQFGKTVQIGIGINTGEVVVGTVGGKQTRIEYTALGDDVNIAARLQKISQPGQITIGENTYLRSQKTGTELLARENIRFISHQAIQLTGKKSTVTVYEVLYD